MFWKDPSAPNTYSSSNKQSLVATSSVVLDHQDTLFNAGPTPSAPDSGANLHVPSRAEGAGGASFTSLKDQNPPPATSMSSSSVRPSSESVAMYVIESAASAGLAISAPLITLANPKNAPAPLIVTAPAL